MSEQAQAKPEARYSLREASKLTSRYRNYVTSLDHQQQSDVKHGIIEQQQHPHAQRTRVLTPGRQQKHGSEVVIRQSPAATSLNVPSQVVIAGSSSHIPQEYDDVVIGAEQEVSTSEYQTKQTEQKIERSSLKPSYRLIHAQPTFDHRRFNTGTDLSDELKSNLRKLKNILKLPKARRFVFCEFFYSGVDQQIFLAENEFSQLMRESFPNLKCTKLRKPEWREVRRLIGKPRRCSQTFLDEERDALKEKRKKIRNIYNGSCTVLNDEMLDLPSYLPRPPVVGQKIYARMRSPKDGIYAATVDAISEDGYRVVFDDDNIPPCVIKDYEVMFDQPSELLSINYFIEQNKANTRGGSKPATHVNVPLFPSTNSYGQMTVYETGKIMPPFVAGPMATSGTQQANKKMFSIAKDEKVGNFPVRMLVILVKLCKVIEYKKQLVGNLTLMNDYAEQMNLMGNEYPEEFKFRFSQIVLDLETINRLFRNYLSALQTHYNTLLPHLSEPQPTDRPELLRKTCNTHAFQIVKHCNSELNVKNKRILHLITSLTSILLQLRTIGVHKKKLNISDTTILSESLKQIRSQITPNNVAAFQDYVEVHMKQMFRMMTKQQQQLMSNQYNQQNKFTCT